MNKLQSAKTICFNLGTEATNATNSALIDTAGFEHVRIDVVMAPASATNSSAKWAALSLGDATATNGTFTTITGTTGTTNTTAASGEFVLPVHNDTSALQTISFFVDKSGGAIERYIRVVAQPHATNNTCAYNAILSNNRDWVGTDTSIGAAEAVYVG